MRINIKSLFYAAPALMIAWPGTGCDYEAGLSFEKDGLAYHVLTQDPAAKVGTVSVWPGSARMTGDLVIPESLTVNGIEYFVELLGSFRDQSIRSIRIPEGVSVIMDGAFERCGQLTSAEIPGSVTIIYSRTFYGCSNLTEIKLLEGVRDIKRHAFSFCEKLKSVEIPDSLLWIEKQAFEDCGMSEPEKESLIRRAEQNREREHSRKKKNSDLLDSYDLFESL
ncbi:MAG: leucine-rich repeat domain-containing protein [Verrucomicrobia bacterium]|nr:leucine-rich repeat domain-containing protein [Verrucomicrobiota bacterium]